MAQSFVVKDVADTTRHLNSWRKYDPLPHTPHQRSLPPPRRHDAEEISIQRNDVLAHSWQESHHQRLHVAFLQGRDREEII